MRVIPARRFDMVLALGLAGLVGAGPGVVQAESLWTARSGSLVTDLRAGRAGDVVTILVDERSSADKSGETKLDRDSTFSSSVTPPQFDYPRWLSNLLLNLRASGTGNSSYSGSGTTARTDRATAEIAARVARVLDNGHLLIEGRKIVVVHDETQTLVVSGVVRPQDVSADNTIRSSVMADAEVRIEGQGVISRRQQPGLFHRLFDFLGLF
jgi:flagellar L-ring protein precursor FlgH